MICGQIFNRGVTWLRMQRVECNYGFTILRLFLSKSEQITVKYLDSNKTQQIEQHHNMEEWRRSSQDFRLTVSASALHVLSIT